MSREIVAAFDFDGTLGRGVSGLRFFRQILGDAGYLRFWARHLVSLTCYGLRIRQERSLETINRAVFRGLPVAELERQAARYAEEILPRHLFPDALELLRKHRREGHRVIILSSGYDVYLRRWASTEGVTEIAATRLSADAAGVLTGEMPEPSCDNLVKRARLLELLGDRDRFELHAYGDRPGDHAMLDIADKAWMRRGGCFVTWEKKREAGGEN